MTEPSRRTWPGPMSTAGVGEGHSHDLPAPLLRRIKLIGWAVAIFGVCLLALGCLFVFLIQARSAERDAEARRIAEQNRLSWCTALDTLPEGVPSLDRLRAIYDCGPGVPFDRLTPEEQEQLQNRQSQPHSLAPRVDPPAPARPTPPPR